MENKTNWRDEELSITEVIEKYPEVSPFIIIKTDAQRRGVHFTDAALKKVDPQIHQTQSRSFALEKTDLTPFSLLMRDGTSILTGDVRVQGAREPLIVDVVDDKIMICDEGKPLEEVFYWEKPDFYNKTTSSGKPMWHIAWARPQRIDINPNQFCQFWQTPGHGCKYCAIAATYRKNDKPQFVNLDDIEETVQEALKQPGRYTSIFLTGGTILDGKELLDDDQVPIYNYVVGREAFAEKYPEITEKVLELINDTWDYADSHQDEYIKFYADASGQDVATVEAAWKDNFPQRYASDFSDDDKKAYEEFVDWMKSVDYVGKDVDSDSLLDLSYVEKISQTGDEQK